MASALQPRVAAEAPEGHEGVGGNPIFIHEDGDGDEFAKELRRWSTLPGVDGLGHDDGAGAELAGDGAASGGRAAAAVLDPARTHDELEGDEGNAPDPGAISPTAEAAMAAVASSADGAPAASLPPWALREWDVKHGGQKEGTLGALRMVLPAVTRMATLVVGSTLATAGYGVGKLGEAVGAGKAVDSTAFRAGFTSWMWSNGIFPTVKHEPLPSSLTAQLQKEYSFSRTPRKGDMGITPLIVSNHISYLDGLVLAACFGAPKVVAMSGSRKVPVFGKLMEEIDVVFVDRSAHDSRKATLNAIQDHCNQWEPGKRPLLIFPEGTTTNGEGLVEFKKGSFIPGKPVRPVLIVYTGSFDPASTTYKQTAKGVQETSDKEWAKQFMGHFIHSMRVHVYPPYIPTQEERESPELYAKNCRAYMESELKTLRTTLIERSWKVSSGRKGGGLGYQFGDVTRSAARKLFAPKARSSRPVRPLSCPPPGA